MSKTVTSRYDVAEHLRTPEEMAAYLEACLEEAEGDAAFIAKALGDIARAKGMAQVAREAGLSRESLYKALSGERSPDFETILKVVGALGLELHAKARESQAAAGHAARRVVAKAPAKAAGARRRVDALTVETAAAEPSKPRRRRAMSARSAQGRPNLAGGKERG
jgi:probable addiction module antidote protein